MNYRDYIAEKLNVEGVGAEEISSCIVVPPDTSMGDYALPCFKFAKVMRKSPAVIAADLAASFKCDEVITSVQAVNGYLNFKVNRAGLIKNTLEKINAEGDKYGSSSEGAGRSDGGSGFFRSDVPGRDSRAFKLSAYMVICVEDSTSRNQGIYRA